MNLDQLVAEAKERIHRSIGQRARFAKAAIAAQAARLRDPRGRAAQRMKNAILRDLLDSAAMTSAPTVMLRLHSGAQADNASALDGA